MDIHENGGTRIGDLHPSSALVLLNQYPRYIVYQEVVFYRLYMIYSLLQVIVAILEIVVK